MARSSVTEIDHGWRRILKEIDLIDNSFVEVGVFSDAGQYQDGGTANILDVATFNEFGTSKIPPRPFMKQTFDRELNRIRDFVARKQDQIYAGRETAKTSLEKLGVWYVGQVKTTFVKGDFIPNAPYTVAKKKSSRPLIDTGRLRNSIQHKVNIR